MKYKYKPKDKKELVKAIKKEIYEVQGTKDNPNWQADLNCIDTSLITDMSDLFSGKIFDIYGLSGFNGNISKWDVSNVKDMSRMFVFCEFNGNISNWDVSNVKNMIAIFYNSEFNRDISNWDVSNVTDMKSMFSNSKFDGDISNWNVSNVEDMSFMFENSKFNKDISKWNVSNVKNMEGMFSNSEFNQNVSNWDVSNVKNMSYMFNSSQFNGDISNWNVSNVENMRNMFSDSQFNQDISNWDVSNVKDMYNMFYKSEFNGDIGSWLLKEKTGLENISISSEYGKLPNKIVSSETVDNILQNKEILYEPETVAKLFVYSLENNGKSFNFKIFFKDYLNNRKELYKNKGYKPEITNKLILNDIADILKYLKDKDMQEKFMEIMAEKNGKESEIEIS